MILGPRLTGKSSLLNILLENKKVWRVNLLHLRERTKYIKNLSLFREDAIYQLKNLKIKTFYIDEIQKIPELLDEVHALIEEFKITVFITGSSPRKLRRGQANLLGGRVPIRELFPFIATELKEQFHLEVALRFGLLPGIYFGEESFKKSQLMTYVDSYLKEEIIAEGIVRNLDPFARFLEVAALYAGQTLNYSNISREAAVALKTVQNYFQVLEDTLIAYKLPAWDKSMKKQLALASKFYFFDCGVVNTLLGRLDGTIDSNQKGFLFEQFVINEVRALKSYKQSFVKMHYWHTKSGSEVDLILSHQQKMSAAIEIKYKNSLSSKDFSGLNSFKEDHPKVDTYLVYLGDTRHDKQQSDIKKHQVVNYREFLDQILPKII